MTNALLAVVAFIGLAQYVGVVPAIGAVLGLAVAHLAIPVVGWWWDCVGDRIRP